MRQSFEDLRLHALGLCLNELHGAGSPAGNFDGAVHLAMGSAADACPHIVLGQKRVKHRRGPGPRFSRGRPTLMLNLAGTTMCRVRWFVLLGVGRRSNPLPCDDARGNCKKTQGLI